MWPSSLQFGAAGFAPHTPLEPQRCIPHDSQTRRLVHRQESPWLRDTEDRVARINHLLSAGRLTDAFDRSTALTRAEPGNANGWCLALAAKRLKRWEDARKAAKETINLVPRWPPAWGEYGDVLLALEKPNEARKAFEMSITIDPDYAYGHLSLLHVCDREKDYDGVICHGRALEKLDQVSSNTLDKIGLAFWYKTNFPMSLRYYTKSAIREPQGFRYGNLGPLYEQLAQYLNASDAYRRALLIEPGHERSLKASSRLWEKLRASSHAVKQSGTQILNKTEFYRFYVNPFLMLGCDANSDIEHYSTKETQKLKKRLIQEIDLEGGQIESLSRSVIDKSRAFSLCDELLDDNKKYSTGSSFRTEDYATSSIRATLRYSRMTKAIYRRDAKCT
jgi:tetratricopeptide (TPR) repeat protein